MSLSDKQWAKQAEALEFKQVDLIRASAAKWRDGLIALTALLSAVTIIAGTEKATDLTPTGRWVAALLLGLALLALLAGSVFAMRAAYGIPHKAEILTGQRLRKWSMDETRSASRNLVIAMISFPLGVLLIAAATAVTWFDDDWFAPQPVPVVAVEAVVAGRPGTQTFCGQLMSSTPTRLVLKIDKQVGPRTLDIAFLDLRGISIVTSC